MAEPTLDTLERENRRLEYRRGVVLRIMILAASFLLWATAASANGPELEVAELIAGIKRAVAEAQKAAAPPYMTIPWMEAEISYVVKKEGEGGFKLYVVTLEGKYATEAVQRVKFRVEPPGKPWKVEGPGTIEDAIFAGVDRGARKVFIMQEASWGVVPIGVWPGTKIKDAAGKIKTLSDLRAGMKGTIEYAWDAGKEQPTALTITIKK